MMRNRIFLFQVFIVIFSGLPSYVFSQNMSVLYELTYKPDPASGTQAENQNYVLDIVSRKSVFRTDFRKQSDSMILKTGLGTGYNSNINTELYFTKDLNGPSYRKYFVSPLSRDRFFIDITDELKWDILPETAIIENIKCQKAEFEYGGRHWIAWFSGDIATSEGPYYFHGLPGLIIQIEDDHHDFLFRVIQIKKNTENSLYETKGGNMITWEQYKKLLQDYFSDPLSSVKAKGMNVMTDDGNGGYKPVDTRDYIKKIQERIEKSNNPVELNQKVEYK
ncbi:GLPGLI family protein [Chryseobacterium sp. SSA4.19]|uniref:GLPGLI family protein n=1 Tax=Chryseobacterium sp. SSA4.19 TaxID=2919915 RepID=UPI001F4E6D46|nr:GLPGLI family protein [Chryseobacterium sp. SSA4.19]MCJ8154458.1 GLPGLI family protein [Chryseobacterium sp. SSA4.19]